jgi:sec-independent protein translocase protein TatA
MNTAVLLFLNIGTPELMVIMFIALMLFGGDKLPGLARGLGRGIRDFKDASEGVKREINNQIYNHEDKKSAKLAENTTEPDTDNETEHGEEQQTENKPLLDYSPIEGTVPLTGYSTSDAAPQHNHEANQHAVQHTETNNTADHKSAN